MNKATDATGGERTRAPKSERQGSAVSKSRARAFGRDEAAKATNPASDTPKKPARKGALWDAEEAAAVRAEQKRAFIRSVQGLCGHIGGSQLPKPNPVDDLIEHINANHFDEIQREFNDAVHCLRGARAGYFVSSTSNDTFEKLIRGCNEQLGLLIEGRKAALREAPATNSNAPVDKYRKPSYSKPMLDRPDIGGAASEQEQSQFVQLARKIGFAAAGKLLVGAAPPEEQRALITGMAACVREVTSPELPPAPLAAEPAPVAPKPKAPKPEPQPIRGFAEMTPEDRKAVLEVAPLGERHATLKAYYDIKAENKNTWADAKGDPPTPEEFKEWLDKTLPDRAALGVVFSDLKHIDRRAYDKARHFACDYPEVLTFFDLPSKITKYHPERDANAPKSTKESYERAMRGEDTLTNLERSRTRTLYHARLG